MIEPFHYILGCPSKVRPPAYVVMPEHVHLLVSEPETGLLATALQALKISVARQAKDPHLLKDPHLPTAGRCGAPNVKHRGTGPFWQKRYYDHNVRSHQSFDEKLHYIHRNPVKRGLVANPEEWPWSSFRHYAFAEIGHVEIESDWTAARRNGRIIRLMKLPSE